MQQLESSSNSSNYQLLIAHPEPLESKIFDKGCYEIGLAWNENLLQIRYIEGPHKYEEKFNFKRLTEIGKIFSKYRMSHLALIFQRKIENNELK